MWLAGSILMAWVTTQNLKSVDRMVAGPDNTVARLRVKALGEEAQQLLRYQSAEQNRWLYGKWELIQLLAGTGFFCIMLFGSREDKLVLLGIIILLLLVGLQRFFITPEVNALGRLVDSAPKPGQSPDYNRFWITHMAHSGVEGLKGLLQLLLAGQMVFSRKRSGRSRDSRRKLDRVDEPYYRSVNR
jgi:hypothetical protein